MIGKEGGRALRLLALAAAGGVMWLLVMRPEQGLQLFWRVLVPSLPLLFAVAPGLWRNVCPMGFANQLPRMLGLSLERTLPAFFRVWCYAISAGLFIGLVALRDPLLDHIDYGAMALRRSVIAALPAERALGLDQLQSELASSARLRACVANERFYEIGSQSGLDDFERYLGRSPG